jgi:ATP-dependent Clp protease ATP-binding subunit ClpC
VDFLSRDLTELARAGAFQNFHGREKVVQQAVTVLSQNGKANVVFTGEPGVGKTAVVEVLAQRIASGTVPEPLRKTSIRELDTNALVAGTIYHGQFEANLKALIDFLLSQPSVIVFMDEIHSILSISSDENRVSPFANFIKPYLARGDIRMIGATTNREYEGMNTKDAALTRRFVRIDVPEPTRDEAIGILTQVASVHGRNTGVTLQDGAIEAAVDLSMRCMQDRRLPEKAIDLLVGCMSRKSAEQPSASAGKSRASIPQLIELVGRELKAIDKNDWGAASALAGEWFTLKSASTLILTAKDIQAFATERYGGIDSGDAKSVEKILGLEADLRNSVVGQDRAIAVVCSALKRMLALGRSARPIGSFLFLGPTGVGKTELCRVVAKKLWGNGALLQYNMSEYMERHEASKLIGSSPGYIGYEEGGRLVRDVANKPSSVVLFDEIEKAHRDVHNLLLQILEEGKLQDGTGKTCSFSQSLVMLTSNIAAEWLSRLSPVDLENRHEEIQRALLDQLKREFRPEIVNRIDEVVIFTPLERVHLECILDLLLAEENHRFKENNRPSLELSPSARQLVLDRGTDRTMGARPLRRALQQTVLTKLADYILEETLHGNLSADSEVIAENRNCEIVIVKKTRVSA